MVRHTIEKNRNSFPFLLQFVLYLFSLLTIKGFPTTGVSYDILLMLLGYRQADPIAQANPRESLLALPDELGGKGCKGLNMHEVCKRVIKPITADHSCSFVDYVALRMRQLQAKSEPGECEGGATLDFSKKKFVCVSICCVLTLYCVLSLLFGGFLFSPTFHSERTQQWSRQDASERWPW